MGRDAIDARKITIKSEATIVDGSLRRGLQLAVKTLAKSCLGPFGLALWIMVGQSGCRLTNPNMPPVIASSGNEGVPAASAASTFKPQADLVSRPAVVNSETGQVEGTVLNLGTATVRAQSPQPYPPQSEQNQTQSNASTAGGGSSYRAPMQATDASQFNRYRQPTVPGMPGQVQPGERALGSLPPPTGAFPSQPISPPTTVFQPQLSSPPPNSFTAPPVYPQGSPSDYGAVIAPGATQGLGTGENLIAPGVMPYAEPDLGFDPTVGINAPGVLAPGIDGYRPRQRIAPIDVYVQEARTGRIIVGGSVNSDLGVAGQVVVDERNFNIRRIPRSWDDVWSGRAFRGGGQNFRMELMPGSRVERYTVSWTERNLLGYLPYSLSVGGFYYTRQFRDWTEQRLGGRVALGYEVTKDLAISGELRMEDVKIFDPRISGVQELDSALGSNDIYTARFRVTHDTRDSPFLATRGGLLELVFDQVFGEYDFSRGNVNYSRYFMVRERPDGTGRHTIATTFQFGVTGSQTPIFENYFAGGYSTLRGFSFRGASPVVNNVQVGGELQLLGSVEYMLPLTADEMLRGVAFVDYGTVEQNIEINSENFRVAPGLGVRISVPALGPAPLAFDFAIPLNYADTDDRQVLSFFMGFTR